MATTTYPLTVTIAEHVDDEGTPCTWCQTVDATVQATVYAYDDNYHPLDLPGLCLACIVPCLDAQPHLNTYHPINVTVCRSATNRPF